MRGISYENRYLVILLSSVINEKKISIPRRQIYWQEMLKLAEFHQVISPVYYGLLGLEKEVSDRVAENFYAKYHKELVIGEAYRDAMEVIAWQMNKNKIRGLLLRGMESRKLYAQWELGYTFALEILVSKKDLGKIHRVMTAMDYELEENRELRGNVYKRVPGIRIIFHEQIPLGNKVLYKYLTESTKKYFYVQKKQYFLRPDASIQYLYRMGELADAYMLGNLKIRDILEYYQFQKTEELQEQIKPVADVLGKAGLTEFIRQIAILAALWFGQGGDFDTVQAFLLEEYIFSKGMENRILDSAIIPYEKTSVDFYQRNREEEWDKKQKEWIFPSKDYMVQFFPILRKFPCLIWICWGIRGIRVFRKSMKDFIKKKYLPIKDCISHLKIKIINKISKGKDTET